MANLTRKGKSLFRPDPDQSRVREVAQVLRLFVAPGQTTELRAVGTWTRSRLFAYDALDDMALAALRLEDRAEGVYFVLNPVQPGTRGSAGDDDIVRRAWFYVDVDPVRAAGFSTSGSTDAEKAAAHETALAVRAHLRALGWPDPVLCDTGNGFHLVYAIDLPADDGGLVRRVLYALKERFAKPSGSPAVKIDTSVSNASRITRLYGTRNKKGQDSPERPWRVSRVLANPRPVQVVPAALLEALAGSETGGEVKESRNGRATVSAHGFAKGNVDDINIPPATPTGRGRNRSDTTVPPLTGRDREVLRRAREDPESGARFTHLWEGGQEGCDSPSEADWHLCCLLAVAAGSDAAMMDRLFRSSGLYNRPSGPKWDSPRKIAGNDYSYGSWTVSNAVTSVATGRWVLGSGVFSARFPRREEKRDSSANGTHFSCTAVEVLNTALERAKNDPPVTGLAVGRKGAPYSLFARLCRRLGRGGKVFFLDQDGVAQLFAAYQQKVSRWLKALVQDGFLELLSTGSDLTRQASEYRWTGGGA